MPGGDGSGPMGWGPRSGRAAGYCSGYERPGYANPIPGRRFCGYGFQRPRFYQEPLADEKYALKHRAEFLREQVRLIEERLKEIDSSNGDNE